MFTIPESKPSNTSNNLFQQSIRRNRFLLARTELDLSGSARLIAQLDPKNYQPEVVSRFGTAESFTGPKRTLQWITRGRSTLFENSQTERLNRFSNWLSQIGSPQTNQQRNPSESLPPKPETKYPVNVKTQPQPVAVKIQHRSSSSVVAPLPQPEPEPQPKSITKPKSKPKLKPNPQQKQQRPRHRMLYRDRALKFSIQNGRRIDGVQVTVYIQDGQRYLTILNQATHLELYQGAIAHMRSKIQFMAQSRQQGVVVRTFSASQREHLRADIIKLRFRSRETCLAFCREFALGIQ